MPTINQLQVSVIIVNYNSCKLLANCLDSIFSKTSNVTFEIIVLDNASFDGCKDLLNEIYRDRVCFIQLDENIGFGRANNAGMKIANGKYILFLNPDTELINNAIKILADFLDSNPGVGIAGPNLYNEDMSPAYSYRRFLPSVFWEFNHFMSNIPEKITYGRNANFNHSAIEIEVAYITGACLMISKELIGKTGVFDPDYFMYFEETDLALRVKKTGKNIVSIPYARVKHLEGGSFNPDSNRTHLYISGREQYYRKNTGRFSHKVANLIFLISINLRLFLFSVLNRENDRRIYWKRMKEAFVGLPRY